MKGPVVHDWQAVAAACARLAQAQVRDPADAADVAQEALMRAWRHRHKMAGATNQTAWLRTVVRNEAARLYGRQTPVVLTATPEAEDDDGLSGVLLRADVTRALSQLSASERIIVILRYHQDLTQPAIAQKLNLPEGTVKVQLHRARQKLRRALQDR